MNTIKEWAEYYYDKGLEVYSSDAPLFNIKFGRHSKEHFSSYDWDHSEWIGCMVGVNRITIITLSFGEADFKHISIILARFLWLLGLYRYPWVIWEGDKVSVLVECHSHKNQGKQEFGAFSIVWTGFFHLPFIVKKIPTTKRFYFESIPVSYPSIIKCDDLWKAIETLIDEFGLFLNKEGTPK